MGRRGGKWEGAELGKVGSTSRLSLQENNLLHALSTQLGGSPRPLMSHPALPTLPWLPKEQEMSLLDT